MPRKLYWIHALTPTHPGIGRGVGYIDLPVERDRVTGWPVIRASSVKGVIADKYGASDQKRTQDKFLRAAFGLSSAAAGGTAGSLLFTDAYLVALPIRSFRGTFAWCTSPRCLGSLSRLMKLTGRSDPPQVPTVAKEQEALHTSESVLLEDGQIFLEDLDLNARQSQDADAWAKTIADAVFGTDQSWADAFRKRFAILHDDLFDFLAETGTEVHTRVRIDPDTGTVAHGALWTEECLPAETILAGMVACDRVYGVDGDIAPNDLMDRYAKGELSLQIGGNATIGQGLVRCVFT